MDTQTMIKAASGRAHRALCAEPDGCKGPTEQELMITAMVLESTVPQILKSISHELRQVLHSMAAGYSGEMSDPDATRWDPDQLLAEWFRWWRDDPDTPAKLPDGLHVRTAAYLTVKAVEDDRVIHGPQDL